MLLLEPDPVRFFEQEDQKNKIGSFKLFLQSIFPSFYLTLA